ncbi:hypothetical protein ACIGW8_05885 [Streptomyces sioyaensis]|uniref:hypothetical protein n=1 Tax=Streptomyces sioyaensis TaxID=67364 RepID=UPI0037D56771
MNELLQTVAGPLPVSAVRGPVLAHEYLALDLTRGADRAATLTPGHRGTGAPGHRGTGAPGHDHRGTGGAAP